VPTVTVYNEVEVEVELDEFSEKDLIEELGSRFLSDSGIYALRRVLEKEQCDGSSLTDRLQEIYEAIQTHDCNTRDRLLSDLIYDNIGRIVTE